MLIEAKMFLQKCEIDVIQNSFSGAKIDKIEVIKLKQTTYVSKFKTAFDVEINLRKSFKH